MLERFGPTVQVLHEGMAAYSPQILAQSTVGLNVLGVRGIGIEASCERMGDINCCQLLLVVVSWC